MLQYYPPILLAGQTHGSIPGDEECANSGLLQFASLIHIEKAKICTVRSYNFNKYKYKWQYSLVTAKLKVN
jgi:hypothetical protein